MASQNMTNTSILKLDDFNSDITSTNTTSSLKLILTLHQIQENKYLYSMVWRHDVNVI